MVERLTRLAATDLCFRSDKWSYLASPGQDCPWGWTLFTRMGSFGALPFV